MGGIAWESSGRLRLVLLAAVAALFVLVPAARASAVAEYALTVNVEGEGAVFCEYEVEGEEEESELEFEECGGTTQHYAAGTEVTLFPFELEDKFKEFQGCDVEGVEECTLTMNEDREVTVVFEPIEEEEGGEEGEEGSGGGGEESGSGGSEGSPSSPQPLPSLPVPVGPGKAKVAGAGLYRGGWATLRISCKGGGRCEGNVKLIAKLKVGEKRRKLTVGKARFSLPAGRSRMLKVKLSRPAKKLLRKGRTLIAKVRGNGVVASKVRIDPTAR